MKTWSDLIFKGQKKFELRKRLPKDITTIYVYESRGCGMIVGKLDVSAIHELPIDKLWELTKDGSCIGENYFKEYYKGKEKGVAIEISEAELFSEPLPISSFGFSSTLKPQNYCIIR